MSLTVLEKVKCPCGESFEAELYQSITVSDHPEHKDLVLGGELNIVKCPTCYEMLYAERFVLYHDMAREFLAFVYPKDMESNQAQLIIQMEAKYKEIIGAIDVDEDIHYRPILIFGMDRVVELISKEEDLLDESDIVENLCKTLSLQPMKIQLSLARQNNIPSVLPFMEKEKDKRKSLLEGLKIILDKNPYLENYKLFMQKIDSNPTWNI